MEFITKIKYIIIHFLYENPLEPIDVSSLVNELTNLNTIIEKFNINNSSKKLEYVSTLQNNIGGFIKHTNKKVTKSNKNKVYRRKSNKNKVYNK